MLTSFDFIIVLTLSFLTSLVAVVVVRQVCRKKEWVAHPQKDRWHTRVTALHGGVGMMVAFLPFYLYAMLTIDILPSVGIAIFLCMMILFFVGLFDDIYAFSPIVKFGWQFLASIIVIWNGILLEFTPWLWVNVLLTVFWIVGITNAINMIDNMDGLSVGSMVITLAFLLAYFFNHQTQETMFVLFLMTALVGVLLGFLIFNINPASIFMGDSGSLFLGFMIAVLPLSTELTGNILGTTAIVSFNVQALLIPVLLLALPITDMFFVSISRTLVGKKFYHGGRDHLSHRLVRIGLSERNAVFVLHMTGLFAAGLAYLLLIDMINVLYSFIALIPLMGVVVVVKRMEAKV